MESDEFRLMKGLPLGLAVLVAVLCSVVMAASGSAPAGSAFATGSGATHSCTKAKLARRATRVAVYAADDARAARLLQNASLEPSPREVRSCPERLPLKALKRAL